MKNEKKVKYSGIGEVLYRRNARARNLAIRINSDGVVKVTVPGRCSFHRAEGFVLDKREWISRKTTYIKRRNQEILVWKAGDVIRMRNSYVKLTGGRSETFGISKSNGSYEVALPGGFDPTDEIHRKELMEKIAAIGHAEARDQLPAVLGYYAERFRLPFRKVTVRRMHTRWGSCSSKNNISLSSGLIFLPEHLIEYVCLHELMHTVHKNHSREFWMALERILPDALQRRKELRDRTIIA